MTDDTLKKDLAELVAILLGIPDFESGKPKSLENLSLTQRKRLAHYLQKKDVGRPVKYFLRNSLIANYVRKRKARGDKPVQAYRATENWIRDLCANNEGCAAIFGDLGEEQIGQIYRDWIRKPREYDNLIILNEDKFLSPRPTSAPK